MNVDKEAVERAIKKTDAPGLYRVDWPDACFAAGVKQVTLTVERGCCVQGRCVQDCSEEPTAHTDYGRRVDLRDILRDALVAKPEKPATKQGRA